MSDNPFAEPDDDRTVFRPMPGGKRGPAKPAPQRPAPPVPTQPPPVARGADLQTLVEAFSNPLIAAASPLLQLLSRLGNTAAPPDQGDMRDRTAREMREFERRAREAGIAMDQTRPAHYALCASLDDVVLNTPWGAHGRWRDRPLAATFHNDDGAGAGFFDQIRLMRADPAKHLNVLELMYLCMALGFMGSYRTTPDGAERMEKIRAQTYELVRAGRGGVAMPPLSERWEGVDAPYKPRRTRFPVWVAACIALAALAGGFVYVLDGLNGSSDRLLDAALAAPPASMPQILRPPTVRPPPPPPEPPPPGPADALRAALSAEIARHELDVVATPSATIVRIPDKSLFPGPNAALSRPAETLVQKIAAALKGAGPISILGYSDNVSVRSVKFPSNFALSKARAETVRDALAKSLGTDAKLAAEGRADADPVAPNATPAGRDQNRRVDIVLPR